MADPDHIDDKQPPRAQQQGRRINWLIVALVAAVLAGVLLASSVWTNQWQSENAVGNDVEAAKQDDPESWCAAQPTYDAIRRELFRRAAQVRGSDEQAYTRLADFALLRVSGPVALGIDDRLKSVSCSAHATLDLPPSVEVAGGRRSLAGELEYVIQPAADGTGNVIRLGNADSIVVPLATLTKSGSPDGAPLPAPVPQQPEQPAAPVQDEQDTAEEPKQPQPATANPSFDCRNARTGSERAVCGDPGLAALDRQMAGQYNAAVSQADRSQRQLLERTRSRFLSFRERCDSNKCIADSYRGRMREIDDIMSGRWRG
jgi:uncharacterized protein YecT (DUF1311 family)